MPSDRPADSTAAGFFSPSRLRWVGFCLLAVGALGAGGVAIRQRVAHYFAAPGPRLHRPEKEAALDPNAAPSEETRRQFALANSAGDLQDRALTEEQHTRFVQILRSAERGRVTVGVEAGDREASLYANRLAAMLHEAGFGKDGVPVTAMTAPAAAAPHPAVLLFVSREHAIPPFAMAIKDAFDVIGIPCEFAYRDSAEHPDDLEIAVYPKR